MLSSKKLGFVVENLYPFFPFSGSLLILWLHGLRLPSTIGSPPGPSMTTSDSLEAHWLSSVDRSFQDVLAQSRKGSTIRAYHTKWNIFCSFRDTFSS